MQKVSIIMTVYNGQNFLREAIESCLNQTYSNLELIIIDDGSTDNTLSIIKSYNDERIKLIENERNKGQSYSRNKGIEESNGEFIAIMDADDIAYPHRIETQLNFLLQSNADICFSCADLIDAKGNLVGIKKTTLNINLLRAQLLFECPLIHPTAFLRKESFVSNELWYDEKFVYAQDYELWSRVKDVLCIKIIDKPLIKFRFRNEQSISYSKVKIQESYRKRISDFLINQLVPNASGISILSTIQIYNAYKKKYDVDSEIKQYFRDKIKFGRMKLPYRLRKYLLTMFIP